MFTGIVQAVGRIVRVEPLEIECGSLELSDVARGDSICVQGVCLTVTALTPRGFTADLSGETLRVTTGLDRPGEVNLEKSLALGDRPGRPSHGKPTSHRPSMNAAHSCHLAAAMRISLTHPCAALGLDQTRKTAVLPRRVARL